jgi:thiazole-adenylate synthase
VVVLVVPRNHLPRIVVEYPASEILREVGVRLVEYSDGLFVVDPAEMIAKLATRAIDAGAKFLLGVHVDDVIYRDNPPRLLVWRSFGQQYRWRAFTQTQYS